MKKFAIIPMLSLLVMGGCKKDETVIPILIEEPISEPPFVPIGKILNQTVIKDASTIDGQFFCPGYEIEIGVTTDLTVDKIIYYGLYISGLNGDTTVMWSREEQGNTSIMVSSYDALEAVIIADVYAVEGNDRTPGVKPLGYDFPPPLIEHQEHPVICAENNFTTILSNGFPGAAHIKWTKDYIELAGETNKALLVNTTGVYDIKISYEECPKYFQSAGGIEVVSAAAIEPLLSVIGNTITVTNNSQLEYTTYQLLDESGNQVQYLGYGDTFENVPSGTYKVKASFWGSEFYTGLGDKGRVSICNSVSPTVTI